MKISNVPIHAITYGDRLRNIDKEEVKKLALSMQDQGLQSPIIIRPYRKENPKNKTQWLPVRFDGLVRYILVAGGHRLSSAELLEWTNINCIIKDPATPLEARLLEIDENLYRHELNALDRAIFLAERKAIYEEMYPETKKGAKNQHTADPLNPTIGFSKATADKIGLSKSTISDCVKIYSGIAPDLREHIKGTALSKKQGDLLFIASCEPARQKEIIDLMLREKDPIKSAVKADRFLSLGTVENKETPADRDQKRLFALIDKVGKSVQVEALAMLIKGLPTTQQMALMNALQQNGITFASQSVEEAA